MAMTMTHDNREIQVPLVHNNGTDASDLAQQCENVGKAIRDVLHALYLATPNARDYYPLGDGAFQRAQREHEARVASLERVGYDILALHEAIVDQADARLVR